MADSFRNPEAEIRGWCNNVLEVPPRRLARHLDALADVLCSLYSEPRPGSAYDPAVLDRLLAGYLNRERITRLKRSPLPLRRW